MFISPLALLALISTSVFATLLPGQDFFYIARHSINGNRLHGLIAVGGIYSGLIFYVLAIAWGLGPIFETFPFIIQIIKILGVCYLLYLSFLLAKEALNLQDSGKPVWGDDTKPAIRIYIGGMLMTLFNPKTAIYFISFLPQFVDPAKGYIPFQLMALGFPMITMGCAIYAVESVLIARYGPGILSSQKIIRIFYAILSATFLCLSIGLLLSRL